MAGPKRKKIMDAHHAGEIDWKKESNHVIGIRLGCSDDAVRMVRNILKIEPFRPCNNLDYLHSFVLGRNKGIVFNNELLLGWGR